MVKIKDTKSDQSPVLNISNTYSKGLFMTHGYFRNSANSMYCI